LDTYFASLPFIARIIVSKTQVTHERWVSTDTENSTGQRARHHTAVTTLLQLQGEEHKPTWTPSGLCHL